MTMKKWGVALLLAGAFGLMGCETTTEASNDNDTISCKVSSGAYFVTKTYRYMGSTYTEDYEVQGSYAILTKTFTNFDQADIDEECADTMDEYWADEVTCRGNTITVYTPYEYAKTLDEIELEYGAECRAIDGTTYSE